jgi:hypothetical protein
MLALLAFLTQFSEVGPNTGFYVDLLNLQWWQTLIVILGLLGLSPAPWLLGLAAGRIQFSAPARKDFERQMSVAETAHEKALTEKDRHYQALIEFLQTRYSDLEAANKIEKERADQLTDAAFEMTDVVRASTHALNSLNQVAREVTEK